MAQSMFGLSHLSQGYPRMISICARSVTRNFSVSTCDPYMMRSSASSVTRCLLGVPSTLMQLMGFSNFRVARPFCSINCLFTQSPSAPESIRARVVTFPFLVCTSSGTKSCFLFFEHTITEERCVACEMLLHCGVNENPVC